MPKKAMKMLRNAIIFLVIFGVMFSNIPFYVLSGVIEGYVKTANIVDKSWHLSQNDNVVDKFASYRNLLEKIKVYEAQAAINFVGSATAFGTNTAYNMSLTALTGGIASSPTEGDIVIAINVIVNTTNGDPGVGTAGYTELVDMYRGDSYDTNLSVSYKIMGASPDTTVSCNPSNSGTRASDCVAMVFRGIDSATPIDVTTTTASSGNSEDVDCPAITPVTAGAVVLCAGGAAGASVDITPTEPSGYTGTYVQTDPGSSGAAVASYKVWPGLGAEDPAPYVMDLGTASANSRAAATLALRPANDPPSLTVTQPDGTGDTVTVGDPYNITYDLADAEEVVTAAFYYDTDTDMVGGTAISGPCATAGEGSVVTCSWDTTGVTPGNYWVYGITNDGVNPEVKALSPGQITINAPANALSVSTSGTQATNLNSGDAAQHIGGGSTAAFQLRMSTTAVNVNSVKLTEQGGSITLSDLTSQKLYYESAATCTYNGIESNVTGTPTGETVTFSLTGVQAPIAPNYLCLYYVFDLNGTNAIGGETIDIEIANPSTDVVLASGQNTDTAAKQLSGTTTVLPNATSVSYQGGAFTDGAQSGYSATITGSGFGVAGAGADRANCSGAVNTGCVRFIVGGNATVASGDVTAWSSTSITFTVDAALASNGGASGLEVVAGSQSDASDLNFYIYPTITSVLANASSARECVVTDTDCDDTDTDGLIKLIGNHFGASPGTVQFTGAFGSISATVHATAEGACDVGGWAAGGTSVCVETNSTITDSVNVGNITLTRTGDSKTHDWTSYRIIPRITSITPSADGVNPDSRTVNGNHFCQSGSCLSAAAWNAAADDGDDVKFGTTNATVTGTPSDTAVAVTVPSLTPGNYSVTLSSSSYASNGKNFSYLDNTPVNPSSLNQYQSNCSTVITDETTTASSTVCLKGAVSGGITGGTLYLQVEVRDSATAFTAATAESAGVSAPAGGTESVSVTPGQGIFKWRARTCHYNNVGTHNLTCTGTGDYPSAAWVEFETGAVPTNDFTIDSNGPVISNISSGTAGEFSVTITWDTNELATTNVNYGTTITGPYNFIAPNPADTTADTITPHSVSISTNLNCGTTYYYIIISEDAQGTPNTPVEQTFTTGTCNPRVMKSVEFDWVEEISPTTATTQQDRASLSAAIQESSDADFTIRSAVLEMRGVMIGSGGSSPTANLWINSASTPTAITFPNTTIPQAYTVRYNIPTPATNLNISPLSASTNTVHFQFGGGFSKSSLVNIKLIVTYDYTP